MGDAGYSGASLPRKLGLADGQRVLFIGLPDHLTPLTQAARFATVVTRLGPAHLPAEGPFDVALVFTTDAADLSEAIPRLRALLAPAGMLWVSWPKKTAKIPTTLTEDVVRAQALACGLVDVKVCAVDAVWSGLKLVIPKALRPGR
ncbi:DUF3052 domain-containing protein [Chelatococcus sp. SYSU_G07232]|uniref:DUF3052 domain-containing protein n=1 Tax=Chelatococcus albus TaxID=3047466 RepID=A0ABT7AIP4_9HYPH|nr:DUF3052 domain-containing protein [Chelatococcus sp. SYSU_G07232]MDJ1159254.1 DUF3052 domain-containing protein [Chelatococcus sp. SYSU_G07232]